MTLPSYEQALKWARDKAVTLKENPLNRDAQYLLVLLHRLKQLEQPHTPGHTYSHTGETDDSTSTILK